MALKNLLSLKLHAHTLMQIESAGWGSTVAGVHQSQRSGAEQCLVRKLNFKTEVSG